MKRVATLVLVALPLALLAQSAPQQPPAGSAPTKPKAKKVWTNEDVENIKGGVSVVGDSKTSSASATETPKHAAAGRQENCASDPWLVAVLLALRTQGVPPNPEYWSDRIFGGLCKDVTLDQIAKAVEGEHTFENGAKFTVNAQPSGDWPDSYAIVDVAAKNRPFLVSYKGEPYLATHVNYIDRVHSNGSHTYNISKITLRAPVSGAVVIFDVKQPIKIDGSLVLQVSK